MWTRGGSWGKGLSDSYGPGTLDLLKAERDKAGPALLPQR